LDAGDIEHAATRAIADLTDFRFYSQPRALPLNLWVAILEGLGLSPGLVRDENTRDRAVRDLQAVVGAELERTARAQGRLTQGLGLWNTPVFTDRFALDVQLGTVVGTDPSGTLALAGSARGASGRSLPRVTLSSTDLVPHLRRYKEFLEELSRFNTIGKLRNLRLTLLQVTEALDPGERGASSDRKVLERSEKLLDLVSQLQPLTTYLAEAQANLAAGHPWSEHAAAARQMLLDDVRRLGGGEDGPSVPALVRELERLKADYVTAYAGLHRELVLDPQADDRRQRLYDDLRLRALNVLAGIELLPVAELEGWKGAVAGLQSCRGFHEGAIADTPTCPFCHLRPVQRGGDFQADAALDQLDARLDDLLTRWRQALRANLSSETAQRSLEAMSSAERQPIRAFLDQTDDDSSVPPGFVSAATQALRGIHALALPVDELLEALKRRFAEFVRQRMRGHDSRNTRLTLGP